MERRNSKQGMGTGNSGIIFAYNIPAAKFKKMADINYFKIKRRLQGK